MKRYWQGFVFEHLALLVDSGMPLHQAMEMVSMDVEIRAMAELLRRSAQKVQAGVSLEEISELRDLMPDGMNGLFTLSASNDQLATNLRLIAEACDISDDPSTEDFRFNFGPMQLLFKFTLFLIVLGTILRINIQHFAKIHEAMGIGLTPTTRLCLLLSQRISAHLLPIATGIMLVGIALWWMNRQTNRSVFAASIIYYVPPFLFFDRQKFYVLIIEYIIAGITMKKSWNTIFKTMESNVSNPIWARKAGLIARGVSDGESLITVMKAQNIAIPDVAIAAEKLNTVQLKESLEEYRQMLRIESRMKYSHLMHISSITVTTVIVTVIGFIVVSMYAPLFSLIGELSN